ncbi:MAG: hypothetical protein ABSC19_01645 [Syntrophorhabdales bacterium]
MELHDYGFTTSVHTFHPYGMFLWYERTTLTNCEQADKKVVFLPIHTSVTKDSLRALADFLDHLEPTW